MGLGLRGLGFRDLGFRVWGSGVGLRRGVLGLMLQMICAGLGNLG